jgi:hypothetical protein
MKNKLYVLEDSPLVIMLYELWCKKFSMTMILYKSVDQFWKNELPNKTDYCLLDCDLLAIQDNKIADFIPSLIHASNCIMTSNKVDIEKSFMQLPVYSKIKALELLENMYFSKDNSLRDSTFL